MAEGCIAAALANVDERYSWKVHFADTMRGGQYVNNWRMAELHAKESPDRVRELEAWGALFDRTKDGRILQRNFGGHKYRSEEHTSELQSLTNLVCRLLLEKKNTITVQLRLIGSTVAGYKRYTIL